MLSRLKRAAPLLFASLFISLALGGCGIKPKRLSPAQGEDGFPHVYPYDPTGKVKNK